MKPLDRAKVTCAIAGIAILAIGTRTNTRMLEWVGLGLLAVAFLLRFPLKGEPPDA